MEIAKVIRSGGIAVIPTDTIYGLVGLALDRNVVEKIYQVKRRVPEKPFIILINKLSDLSLFDIKTSEKDLAVLKSLWPGKISIVFDCNNDDLEYLHRGTNTLAFRIPDNKFLIELIEKTGPLVAPSANISGEEPAKSIDEAKKYFGRKVNIYLSGKVSGSASTLVKFKDGQLTLLREGPVKL